MTSDNKTFLVIGAGGGIGSAVCEALTATGHSVIGTSRSLDKLPPPGPGFTPAELALDDLKTLPGALENLVRNHPEIDGLICCAGQGRFGSLEEFSYQQINEMMDINFTSTAYACRALVPHLKKRKGGDIVIIGSEAALVGSKMGTLYCAAKFALRGFSQALRAECAGNGLRVTLINPGMVKTPFFDELRFAPGDAAENYIEAQDVAQAAAMVVNTRHGTHYDEINLSPLKKVINFNKK